MVWQDRDRSGCITSYPTAEKQGERSKLLGTSLDTMWKRHWRSEPRYQRRRRAERKRSGKFVFLHELALQDEVDADRIRNETLNVLVAGRDTTAALLGMLWFVLARRPDVWKVLLAEVDELQGQPPTYDSLRNMKYLKYCVQESRAHANFNRGALQY